MKLIERRGTWASTSDLYTNGSSYSTVLLFVQVCFALNSTLFSTPLIILCVLGTDKYCGFGLRCVFRLAGKVYCYVLG